MDVSFNNLNQYLQTRGNIQYFSKNNFALGEYYLVIRNDTSAQANRAFEFSYQFVGDKLMVLRHRLLSLEEIGNAYKIIID